MRRHPAAVLIAFSVTLVATPLAVLVGSSSLAARATAAPRGGPRREPPHVATTVFDVTAQAPLGVYHTVPTAIWYPAVERDGRLVADRAQGPYPLVVFSQGYDMAVSAYAGLLGRWAAAGFVVAAPTYPYTAPPGPLDEADILNHPAELRSVISALTRVAHQPGSSLWGLVDAAEVGLAGQSDGGDVSLAVADNKCCRDPAVKALAVLSGAELSSFRGSYFAGPQVPLLVVQGDADKINPPACSSQIYNQARAPKYYLDLFGASHLVAYAGKSPGRAAAYRRVAAQVTTDFFEAELAGEKAALPSLERAGDVPGVARLTVGAHAPATSGWCPGAP